MFLLTLIVFIFVAVAGSLVGLKFWVRPKEAIERGELPIRRTRFGARGLVFVSRADVLAYLKSINEESAT